MSKNSFYSDPSDFLQVRRVVRVVLGLDAGAFGQIGHRLAQHLDVLGLLVAQFDEQGLDLGVRDEGQGAVVKVVGLLLGGDADLERLQR